MYSYLKWLKPHTGTRDWKVVTQRSEGGFLFNLRHLVWELLAAEVRVNAVVRSKELRPSEREM